MGETIIEADVVYNHDKYGGMTTPNSELAGDFAKASTKKRAFEYDNHSSLKE